MRSFKWLLVLALITCAGMLLRWATVNRSVLRASITSHEAAPAPDSPVKVCGGAARSRGDGFAGYGWSVEPDSRLAVTHAVDCATHDAQGTADLATVFFSAHLDAQAILDSLRSGPHPIKHVFGVSSHEGILCADGYHTSPAGAVGVLAMRLGSMSAGVGGASFDEAAPGEAAKLAYRRALVDADAPAGAKPSMILFSVTLPNEEAALAGLAEETGPGIPLIGGTAAGTLEQISRKKISNWSIIANDKVIRNGVGLTVFFSKQDFASAYGGGYRRTTTSGVITKCQSRLILEIDGRPAAEVYDQWLGGRVAEAAKRGENLVTFCTVYPLCRTLGTYNQFIRAWPSGDPKAPGSLRTGVGVKEGDRVYLSEGNWNTLLNYFTTIPQKARDSRPDLNPMAGLFIYCGGAMECIPTSERPQMAFLVGQNMKDIPWLGIFTWGEQANVAGVGNVHASLSAGTLFFPDTSIVKP